MIPSGTMVTTLLKGGGADPVLVWIAQVWAGGRRGFAYPLWLPNTLYRERTGASATTLCAPGDPVGSIRDWSGNGNWATAVADGKRGVMRQSGGLTWVETDGTDDSYRIASLTLGTSQYEWLAFDQTNNAKALFTEQGANATINDGHFFYGTNASPWYMRRSASNFAEGVASWASGKHVNERQYIANVGGSYLKDGVAQPNGIVSGAACSEADVTAQYNLFSRNQTSVFSAGNYYGHFLVDGAAPSAALILQGRQILATRSGVTL